MIGCPLFAFALYNPNAYYRRSYAYAGGYAYAQPVYVAPQPVASFTSVKTASGGLATATRGWLADPESSLLCLVGMGLYRHYVAADVLCWATHMPLCAICQQVGPDG